MARKPFLRNSAVAKRQRTSAATSFDIDISIARIDSFAPDVRGLRRPGGLIYCGTESTCQSTCGGTCSSSCGGSCDYTSCGSCSSEGCFPGGGFIPFNP